jgi:hypothetical protein
MHEIIKAGLNPLKHTKVFIVRSPIEGCGTSAAGLSNARMVAAGPWSGSVGNLVTRSSREIGEKAFINS